MKTYFTADTHFGHAGILSARMQRPRPFASIEAHDEALIAAWNNRVRPDDEVWHLGDFAYAASAAHCRAVFARLNGRKRLVCGNHDANRTTSLPWYSQHERAEPIVEGPADPGSLRAAHLEPFPPRRPAPLRPLAWQPAGVWALLGRRGRLLGLAPRAPVGDLGGHGGRRRPGRHTDGGGRPGRGGLTVRAGYSYSEPPPNAVTCRTCGRMAIVITRQEAERRAAEANASRRPGDPRPPVDVGYWCCCVRPRFRRARLGDCPEGATFGSVVCDGLDEI